MLTDTATATAEDFNRIRGCLIGGAVGDALGAPVEFMSLAQIRLQFGAAGIREMTPLDGVMGAITDDTQMTLFTAEGLLRAFTRDNEEGMCHPATIIHYAYLRWLHTQDGGAQPPFMDEDAGWLVHEPRLHVRRSPGGTCLSALRSGRMGTIEKPINDSKGCGGVMRVAPIGLVVREDPFEQGCEAAAITHGHPSGYLAAGCLAGIIASLADGSPVRVAVDTALERVKQHPGHEETTRALRRAIELAESTTPPSAEAVESLGGGWVAEEALAIAVYCALVYEEDFEEGVILAVNHGGDSDSTGAITGNILGARRGASSIPTRWIEALELRDVIETIACDLSVRYEPGDAWWERYPGC